MCGSTATGRSLGFVSAAGALRVFIFVILFAVAVAFVAVVRVVCAVFVAVAFVFGAVLVLLN